MKLDSDFYWDWLHTIRTILQNDWGVDVSDVPEDQLPLTYFSVERNRLRQVVRPVEVSDAFSCPKAFQTGWERLKK